MTFTWKRTPGTNRWTADSARFRAVVEKCGTTFFTIRVDEVVAMRSTHLVTQLSLAAAREVAELFIAVRETHDHADDEHRAAVGS